MSVLELVGERQGLTNVMHVASGWAKVAALRQVTARTFSSSICVAARSRQSEITFSAMFALGSSLRVYSSRPFHPFTSVVEEWITSEVSLYGVRPTARFGAWLSLLSQNGKDSR